MSGESEILTLEDFKKALSTNGVSLVITLCILTVSLQTAFFFFFFFCFFLVYRASLPAYGCRTNWPADSEKTS